MRENRKEKLRIYIEEQRQKPLPKVLEREAKANVEGDLINDFIGPRRAGKTYLMFLLMRRIVEKSGKKPVIYINFESRRLFPLDARYFDCLIEILHEDGLLENTGRVYLFLDEIQRVRGWERYVRSIYDEFKGKVKIFISGSTSKLTKSGLGHLLTGRHLSTLVFPLSFREMLSFREIEAGGTVTEEKRAKIGKSLEAYLTKGGFPEVVLGGGEDLLETLFMDVINRDIMPRVKRKEILEDIAYFLCSHAGKLTSFSKLSRLLKSRGVPVSVPTLEKYFWMMKDSFLFFDVSIFSYKVRDQLQYPRKIYCIDNGFVNYFGFRFSEDRGRAMENCVAVQLQRRCLEGKKRGLYYWKSRSGYEVDFVLKDGLDIRQLIQACYDVSDPDVKKREFNALVKASEELNCDDLLVVTYDHEGMETFGGKKIRMVPLWKWLLSG